MMSALSAWVSLREYQTSPVTSSMWTMREPSGDSHLRIRDGIGGQGWRRPGSPQRPEVDYVVPLYGGAHPSRNFGPFGLRGLVPADYAPALVQKILTR